MPSFPIQLKRNGTAAATPSSLLHGEVALNYADGKLFWKDASNVIQSFTFQAYALASHTHAASDITSGTLDAARLPLATTGAVGGVIVGTGLGVSSGTVSVTYGTTSGTACQGNDSRLSDARTPTAHKTSHATGGSDALTPSDIGAAPTASPAFTGAATVTNDGNVVPLTVTNTGTANSFVVNDENPETSPFVIDASGRVGIRKATPSVELDVFGIIRGITGAEFGGWAITAGNTSTAAGTGKGVAYNFQGTDTVGSVKDVARIFSYPADNDWVGSQLAFWTRSGDALFQRLTISSGGVVNIDGGGSQGAPILTSTVGGSDTGLWFPAADVIAFSTAGSERVRVDASGNVGIGAAPSYRLHIAGAGDPLFLMDASSSQTCAMWFQRGGVTKWYHYVLSADDSLNFGTPSRNPIVRLDTFGNVRINGADRGQDAEGCLHIKNGTAPTLSINDGVILFAADVSSSSELRVRDEAGNTTTLSPHAFPLIPDGPSEPMAWAYYSERDGRRINVDMLRVVRLLEQLTGEKLVYED